MEMANKYSTVTVSAPSKIHLIGEHFVVYGRPAILTTIDLRVYLTVSKSAEKTGFVGLVSHDGKLKILQKNIEKLIERKFKVKIPNYSLLVKTNVPLGSGLGSSASLCAVFAAGLLKFLKLPADKEILNELAFEGDKVFNGNPSGGDNTTVVFGGFIWFRKETEDLKTFIPLPFKISRKIKNFYLINSGKPKEQTAEMVEIVENKKKNLNLFDDQEKLTKELVGVLKDGDEELLVQIFRQAENNLEKLGVVGKRAKEITQEIEKVGGGAKISGGGGVKEGSGMIIAYHRDYKVLIELAKLNNWEIFKIKLGEEGTKYETTT